MALAPIDQAFANHQPVETLNARAYSNLGAIYLKQQKWPEAIDAYQKAAASTTARPRTTTSASSSSRRARWIARRTSIARRWPAIASLPLAYLHLGTIAFKAAKYDDAIKLLRDGMPHFDADSKRLALRMLGRAQLIRGDRAGARASLEEAVTLDRERCRVAAAPRTKWRDTTSVSMMRNRCSIVRRLHLRGTRSSRSSARSWRAMRTISRRTRRAGSASADRRRAARRARDRQCASESERREPARAARDDSRGQRGSRRARREARSRGEVAGAERFPDRARRCRPSFLAARISDDARPHLAVARQSICRLERGFAGRRRGCARREALRRGGGVPVIHPMRCRLVGRSRAAARTDSRTGVDVCCARKSRWPIALLSQAADDLDRAVKRQDDAAARRARQLADRAASLDERRQSLALFIRGTADLVTGGDAPRARRSRARSPAISRRLSSRSRKRISKPRSL